MSFHIRKANETDKPTLLEIVRSWGADFIVSRGRKVYPSEIDAFLALTESDKLVGLVTYEITGDQCEIVTLDAFEKYSGIGTSLIDHVIETIRPLGVQRLWLIATNDNIDAIRFYQKRQFRLSKVHKDAVVESRKIKPSIPEIGMYGIPLRDEIEFERLL